MCRLMAETDSMTFRPLQASTITDLLTLLSMLTATLHHGHCITRRLLQALNHL